jgi:hypothetical protein
LFGSLELPELPPNAHYVFHENRCYDWGTIGWAIREGKVDASAYRHIVFMNSSVRGPFLPPYLPVSAPVVASMSTRLGCQEPTNNRLPTGMFSALWQ